MKLIATAIMTMMLCGSAWAQGSAAAGSAGTAATGGTSASSIGAGATTSGPGGNASALGMGASAAGGHAMSRSAVHGNNNLNGQAMAQAHEGGTFSKSHTVCHDGSGSVDCRTKSMAHEPGSAPVKSTSSGSATVPR